MTAPENPSIAAALNAVMRDVQNVSKNQRVTSGPAQFNFRGVDAVVNVVGPVLREHGVIVVPHHVEEVREERYSTKSGSQMHAVILRITWRFYGPDGSFIEASSVGEAADAGDKASPKAHSVAYRTVLLQALCIPTDEPDPDSQVHERGNGGGEAPWGPSDWAAAISSARSPQELTDVGKRLAASPLAPAARQPLKTAWTARMGELNGAST